MTKQTKFNIPCSLKSLPTNLDTILLNAHANIFHGAWKLGLYRFM